MGLLKHIRRTRAHGFALNFILNGEWKGITARLAKPQNLKNIYEKKK